MNQTSKNTVSFGPARWIGKCQTPAPSRDGKPAPAAASLGASKSVQQLVEHILTLSFGETHRPQIERFVRAFFEYREAGLFR